MKKEVNINTAIEQNRLTLALGRSFVRSLSLSFRLTQNDWLLLMMQNDENDPIHIKCTNSILTMTLRGLELGFIGIFAEIYISLETQNCVKYWLTKASTWLDAALLCFVWLTKQSISILFFFLCSALNACGNKCFLLWKWMRSIQVNIY